MAPRTMEKPAADKSMEAGNPRRQKHRTQAGEMLLGRRACRVRDREIWPAGIRQKGAMIRQTELPEAKLRAVCPRDTAVSKENPAA